MRSVVGIICEYNPFHKGHKYQIDQVRACEPDATIVAIMSGNIVQRGEFALINKYDRARIALECGVNAVFEIPYPYSGSCAEVFANAGVEIANKIGCDSIYFGVEKLSIDEIELISQEIDSDRFQKALKSALREKNKSVIAAKEKALKAVGLEMPKFANDILALEYIRAIKKKNLTLGYKGIKRVGAHYNDKSFGEMMSASAIRNYYYETGKISSVPEETKIIYDEIIDDNRCISFNSVNRFLHSYSLTILDKKTECFDTTVEMLSLIKNASMCATDSENFVSLLSSKVFTTARLKRAILYSLFNIGKVDFSPKFTILLGIDEKGRDLLNKIKKKSEFYVITKHSDGKKADEEVQKNLELVYSIDALHNTLLLNQIVPGLAYKNKPIIKSKKIRP